MSDSKIHLLEEGSPLLLLLLYLSCQHTDCLLNPLNSNLDLGARLVGLCVAITLGSLSGETPAVGFREVFEAKRRRHSWRAGSVYLSCAVQDLLWRHGWERP